MERPLIINGSETPPEHEAEPSFYELHFEELALGDSVTLFVVSDEVLQMTVNEISEADGIFAELSRAKWRQLTERRVEDLEWSLISAKVKLEGSGASFEVREDGGAVTDPEAGSVRVGRGLWLTIYPARKPRPYVSSPVERIGYVPAQN